MSIAFLDRKISRGIILSPLPQGLTSPKKPRLNRVKRGIASGALPQPKSTGASGPFKFSKIQQNQRYLPQ